MQLMKVEMEVAMRGQKTLTMLPKAASPNLRQAQQPMHKNSGLCACASCGSLRCAARCLWRYLCIPSKLLMLGLPRFPFTLRKPHIARGRSVTGTFFEKMQPVRISEAFFDERSWQACRSGCARFPLVHHVHGLAVPYRTPVATLRFRHAL